LSAAIEFEPFKIQSTKEKEFNETGEISSVHWLTIHVWRTCVDVGDVVCLSQPAPDCFMSPAQRGLIVKPEQDTPFVVK
jgi:hypothetical protein